MVADRPPRYAVLDMARGIAIIGVVIYHFIWDLRYLDFIGINMRETPLLVAFQAVLLASFLLLAGASLFLAHRNGMRWGAFWRRVGVLTATALLVSAGTMILLPAAFVYFGVLHALALFAVLALPFLRLPVWMTLVTAATVIILPAYAQSDMFYATWLSWIGFWTVAPATLDLVPVFPCFAWVLIGIALTKLALRFGADDGLGSVDPSNKLAAALKWAGRKSLWIYLLHQLVLLGILFPLQTLVQPGTAGRVADFTNSCMSNCTDLGNPEAYCTAYCQCSLEQVEADDLWDVINSTETTQAQLDAAGRISRLCSAMAE